MKNRGKIISGCLGGSLLVLMVLGIGAVFLWRSLPEVGQQIPDAPTLITLSQPFDGAQFPPNEPITMEAQVISAIAIQSVEWWVNGQLYSTSMIDLAIGENSILYWAFMPEAAASYQVVARAVGSDGHTLDSNLVHINIVEGSSGSLAAEYIIQEGQTIEDIGIILDSPPQQIINNNPGLPQTGPLPTGTSIQAPIPAYATDIPLVPVSAVPSQEFLPPPQGGNPPSQPPNKLFFWLGTFLTQAAPAAPVLSYTSQQCDVQLFVQDQANNEQGFNLYHYDSKGAKELIAQFGPSAGSGQHIEYTDTNVQLNGLTYVVAAFNQSGEVLSNLVQVIPGDDCTIVDAPQRLNLELSLSPVIPLDKTYCYFSTNQGLWKRIPAHPEAFFVRSGASFDLGAELDAFAFMQLGDTLDIECWGWAGEDLQFLGRGFHTLSPEQVNGSAAIELENAGLDLSWQNGVQILAEDKTYVVYLANPTNLRVTSDPAECADHYGSGFASLLAGLVCGELINPSGGVITHDALVWEWQATHGCFPQPNQVCINIEEPDGYYLYRIPITLFPGHIIKIPDNLAPYKHIASPDQKVVLVPLPWPPSNYFSWCYGVAAYKDVFGVEYQEYSNLLCLGINYP